MRPVLVLSEQNFLFSGNKIIFTRETPARCGNKSFYISHLILLSCAGVEGALQGKEGGF